MQALYQLADHVLDPALSTPERRAVWQALVVGCTRTIGVGNVRTEPSEVIDHLSLNIAKQLTVNSNAVISLLASICSTSTPASLAKSVDLLLEKLALGDDETIPALVKICALRTIGDCATRKDNRDAAGNPCCTTVCRVEYAGYLARTLERTALTGVIADAARQLCRLLTGEAMLILSSTQDRAASDFVKFGQGQRITRLVERATTALESTSKERGTSLEPVTIANLNLALDAAQVIDALVTAEGVTLRLSRFLPKALTPTANALISRICLKLMAGKPVS